MKKTSMLDSPSYTPGKLLDAVIKKLQLRNDAGLCRALEMETTTISKMRNGKVPIGSVILIRMHEVTDLPISELKAFAGI